MNDHFPFGPDFASRLEATYSLWGMLKLLERCRKGQFTPAYQERVEEDIALMCIEIEDSPVRETFA